MTFEFDLNLESFLSFSGPNGLVWGSESGSINVLESTHVVEQLSFFLFLSFLTIDFDINFGVIFDLLGP